MITEVYEGEVHWPLSPEAREAHLAAIRKFLLVARQLGPVHVYVTRPEAVPPMLRIDGVEFRDYSWGEKVELEDEHDEWWLAQSDAIDVDGLVAELDVGGER